MRELRVEDALLYLDQVKIEFGDRPHIYNEFLDIMKTFKTQQLDTPGVIRRVSSLFHGNKKLVLGFNTFLPEGYKIELPMDGDGPPVAVYRAPGQSGVTQILGPGAPAAAPAPPTAQSGSMGSASAPAAAGQPPSMMAQQQNLPSQQSSASSSARPAMGPPHQQQMQQLRHGVGGGPPHAHAHGPPHQPQSLTRSQQQGPMVPSGPAPAGQHGGGGGMVVDQPPAGTSGGPYQQHVPHAPSQQQAMQMQHATQVQAAQSGQQQSQSHQVMATGPRMQGDQQHRGNGAEQQAQARPAHPEGITGKQHPPQVAMAVGPGGIGTAPGILGPPPRPGEAPHSGIMPHPHARPRLPDQDQPPVEFDHAINYVTTIKKRFATEPETYKKFLEILHTYQKEQRGIKEVLDEVSLLFADHPDLLKEFTYFLPDAVQAQAKAQLDQVAKESEARKRALSSKQAIMQTAQGMQRQARGMPAGRGQAPMGVPGSAGVVPGGLAGPGGVYTPAPAPIPFGATQGRSDEREREICRSAVYGVVSFSPKSPPRRKESTSTQKILKNGRPQMIPEQPLQPSTAEAAFFERAKLHLNRKELAPDKPPGSRRHTPYTEFLKCLHLYGSGILNKEELFLLLRGLFMQGHAPKSGANAGGGASNPAVASDAQELLREFEEVMVGRGPYADQETLLKDKSKFGSLTSRDFDSSNVERVTPSYRTYPSDYPHNLFFSHSGQTEMDAAVLNSKSICVAPESGSIPGPISPEDYNGVKARRNAYEEAMFRVEDERFEVDMAIERNVMVMRQVEPLAEEISQLRETEEKDGQPIGRLHYKLRGRTLNGAQINAIARLYGDSGDEVIGHLMRNPIAVLPIVYQRLREKDMEWRKAKTEMTKRWKSTCEANSEGSLDVLCYFYKRELERSFASDQLLEECKRALHFAIHPMEQAQHPATRPFQPEFFSSSPDEGTLLFQPHLRLPLSTDVPHKDAFQCILMQTLNGPSMSSADRERVARIWAEFVVPWFKYPVHWVVREVRESVKPDKSSTIVMYAPGQSIRTAFGDGRIISLIEGNNNVGLRYKVELPYGTGFIRPSAIIHALPSNDKAKYVRNAGYMESFEEPLDSMDGADAKMLANDCELLFATESVYVFMRLYCLLVSILSDTRESLSQIEPPKADRESVATDPVEETTPVEMEVDGEGDEKGSPSADAADASVVEKQPSYEGVIASLEKLLVRDIDAKTHETYCRKASKEKVHQLAAVPKLVKSCAEALLKAAREDAVLALYDFSQLKEMNPVQLRSQSLSVTTDACYRIQYDPARQYIYFGYLPADGVMLMEPQEGDAAVESNGDVYMDDEGEAAVDSAPANGNEDAMMEEVDDELHQAKRIKLK